MPIFEYRCTACGFQNDYLRKAADENSLDCPTCRRPTMTRQLSAPAVLTGTASRRSCDAMKSGACPVISSPSGCGCPHSLP